jgi:hypothetical protein
MSKVSSIGGSQQQYFQIGQNQSNAAQANQGGPANAAGTGQVAAAATNQALTKSSAAKTQSPTSQNAKPSQAVTSSSGTKSVESAATHNADGTFGPKHTLRPPLSYTLLHESTSVSTSVDVKA